MTARPLRRRRPAGLGTAEGALSVVPGDGPETLEDLMARTARGDAAAFAALYDRLAPAVYGLVRKVLRDPAMSEEVAQEVLLEVWRKAARFDPAAGSVASWVMTVAHRRAVDRVRSEQACGVRDDRAGRRDLDAPVDSVAEGTQARLEAEQVRRALGGLTELQRQAIELAYYGGHTYPEVAALLGAPLGTVKTRIRDGLVRLRDALGVEAP